MFVLAREKKHIHEEGIQCKCNIPVVQLCILDRKDIIESSHRCVAPIFDLN